MKTTYKKIKSELADKASDTIEFTTPLGGTISIHAGVPAAMSSRRDNASAIGFNTNEFATSVWFDLEDVPGTLTLARKSGISSANHAPEFSEKTFKRLIAVGCSPAMIADMEKTLPGLIERIFAGAYEANASVNFDVDDYFGTEEDA